MDEPVEPRIYSGVIHPRLPDWWHGPHCHCSRCHLAQADRIVADLPDPEGVTVRHPLDNPR